MFYKKARRLSSVGAGIALLVVVSALLTPQAVSGSTHLQPVTLDDLLSLKQTYWVDLSADGSRLAYVVGEDVWIVCTQPNSIPVNIGQGMMPRWSPDGQRLAFYSTRSGTFQLWVFHSTAGQAAQVTYVAKGINPDFLTRFVGNADDPLRYGWSPDGSRLVFASQGAIEGTADAQTSPVGSFQSDLEPNEPNIPLVLTKDSPYEIVLQGVFHNDSLYYRFVNGRPSQDTAGTVQTRMTSQIFIADVNSNTTTQLTKDHSGYYNPDWSPDGQNIVCGSAEGRPMVGYGPSESNIYIISIATGRKTALTVGTGQKRLPYWSPDGRWVAYLSGPQFGMQSLFVVSAEGGKPTRISEQLDRMVTEFYWAPEGKSIYVSCRDGISRRIVRIDAQGRAVDRVIQNDAYNWPFALSRSGTLVWVQSDGSASGVVNIRPSPNSGASYALLELNPQIKKWALGSQEVVRWKNSRGQEIEGILLRPSDYQEGRQYPLIVDLYSLRSNGFMGDPYLASQTFASRGYVVFFPNHRSPHMTMNLMKDEAYSQAARGPEGVNIMVDDILTGVDFITKRGGIDPKHIGLYGYSNGATALNSLVTRTRASSFKCAVSTAGIADWVELFNLLTDDPEIALLMDGKMPWEDPNGYIEISPIFHLDKIDVPMLLTIGDKDAFRLLDNIAMYNGLRRLGRTVTLVRYPNQGHELGDEVLTDYWERVFAFFDKYLKSDQVIEKTKLSRASE